MIARARMKRVQKIMAAVRTHQQNTQKQKDSQPSAPVAGRPNPHQDITKKIIGNKIKALRGRIATGRKRARDLWTK